MKKTVFVIAAFLFGFSKIYAGLFDEPLKLIEVGEVYQKGEKGFEQNLDEALKWFKLAADQNHVAGQHKMGEVCSKQGDILLREGNEDAAQEKYRQAREYYERAMKNVHDFLSHERISVQGSAMNNLGYLYAKGYGVDQNYTKAKELWEKAAAKGDPEAAGNLNILRRNHPKLFEAQE